MKVFSWFEAVSLDFGLGFITCGVLGQTLGLSGAFLNLGFRDFASLRSSFFWDG